MNPLPQTHPNVDKKLFTTESLIGLKNPEKSFPLNNDVGVLKWRLQTTDESLIPLTSQCSTAYKLMVRQNNSAMTVCVRALVLQISFMFFSVCSKLLAFRKRL